MWTSQFIQMCNGSEMPSAKRVCVIGAGPSGMSVLYHFNKRKKEGKEVPDIVCFEKQTDWGGLWKYCEETGTDRYGEPVHGSMYRGLWSNGPKEGLEYPDFSFEEHFGKPIPSFPPREAIYDYLKGRWTKHDLRHWIRFNHVVRQVTYNDATNDFSVVVKNLPEDKVFPAERFDFVVVAVGHFSAPNVPVFPGIDHFPGRVIHSHDFRSASDFKGKKLLVVGAGLSAEDIALQCLKYGAEYIICSWRTKPMGHKWPPRIAEKPLLTNVEGHTVRFKDGTSAEVDDIILCTGYHHSYPFLEQRLRLSGPNGFYPEGLYKAILWTRGGNNKVFYIGVFHHFYTFTMFDVQALWAVNCIMGDIKFPDQEAMESDIKSWIARMLKLNDPGEKVDFQTEYITDVSKDADYGYNLDASAVFHSWIKHRMDGDITNYRSHSFTNIFTGKKSPLPHTPFMQEFDDSVQHFLNPEE